MDVENATYIIIQSRQLVEYCNSGEDVLLRGHCIVNAYCQFSQQVCTKIMQTSLYSLNNINPFLYNNDQFALTDTSDPELLYSHC